MSRASALAMQPVQDLTIDSTVGRAQYQFFLENPSQAELSSWTPKLVGADAAIARIRGCVQRSRADQGRQLLLTIDRPTAARFGITPATIDNALYDAFGQRIASTFYTQSNQYRVILKADVASGWTIRPRRWPGFTCPPRRRPRPGAAGGDGARVAEERAVAARPSGPAAGRNPFPSTWRPACRSKRRWRGFKKAEADIGLPESFSTPSRAPCRPSRSRCPTS